MSSPSISCQEKLRTKLKLELPGPWLVLLGAWWRKRERPFGYGQVGGWIISRCNPSSDEERRQSRSNDQPKDPSQSRKNGRITERLYILLSWNGTEIAEIDWHGCSSTKKTILIRCRVVGDHDARLQRDDALTLYTTLATDIISGADDNKQICITLCIPLRSENWSGRSNCLEQ